MNKLSIATLALALSSLSLFGTGCAASDSEQTDGSESGDAMESSASPDEAAASEDDGATGKTEQAASTCSVGSSVVSGGSFVTAYGYVNCGGARVSLVAARLQKNCGYGWAAAASRDYSPSGTSHSWSFSASTYGQRCSWRSLAIIQPANITRYSNTIYVP